MGLFGKIFEKKSCSICGGEIGLLGNRKLEDGNLCKNCAGKLSPYLDDRRHTTVAGIQEHLNYREANRKAVAAFQPTRTIGGRTKVMIDEHAGNFLVTSSANWRSENPDVVPICAVSDVTVKINESKTELKQDRKLPDGKTEKVSYNPPRYKFTYSFVVKILMQEDFPWFRDITLYTNDGTVAIDSYETAAAVGRNRYGTASVFNPNGNVLYQEASQRAYEIQRVLLDLRSAGMTGHIAAEQPAPEAVAVCPYCGTAAAPGAKFCTACGAPLK